MGCVVEVVEAGCCCVVLCWWWELTVGAPAGKEGDPSPESKLAFGEVGDEEPLLGLTRDCKRNKGTLSI